MAVGGACKLPRLSVVTTEDNNDIAIVTVIQQGLEETSVSLHPLCASTGLLKIQFIEIIINQKGASNSSKTYVCGYLTTLCTRSALANSCTAQDLAQRQPQSQRRACSCAIMRANHEGNAGLTRGTVSRLSHSLSSCEPSSINDRRSY